MSRIIKTSNKLTIVSSADASLDSVANAVNLGTSTSNTVNVGRSGKTTTIAGNVLVSNLALNNTKTNYVGYDAGTKEIVYGNISTLPNIYNIDGSLTSSRIVTLNGFNLNILGTGATTIVPSLSLNLDSSANGVLVGANTANLVTISRTGITTTVNGSLTVNQSVTLNGIATDNTATSILSLNGSAGVRVRALSTIPNVYNSNGILTSNRTIDQGGFNLTVLGNGNYLQSNTGTAAITPTSTLTAGTLGQIYNANGFLYFNNIPVSSLNGNGYVTINTVTKQVGYVSGGNVIDDIFSVGSNGGSYTTTGVSTIPSSFLGMTLSTILPNNHFGYDNTASNGDTLNLVTGRYTPVVSRRVEILAKVVLRNTTEIPNIVLEFYNATLANVVCYASHQFGAINVYNTYTLVDRIQVNAASDYFFRINLLNTAGSTYEIESVVLSVNII